MFAPAGTPREIIVKLKPGGESALKDPQTRERVQAVVYPRVARQQAALRIKDEIERAGR